MKIKLFMMLLVACTLAIFSCSEDPLTQSNQNELNTESNDQLSSSFTERYHQFAESNAAIKRIIHQSGPVNFEENEFLKLWLNQSNNPTKLKKRMDLQARRFENLAPQAGIKLLEKDGILSQNQSTYLVQSLDIIEARLQEGELLTDVISLTRRMFETKHLVTGFSKTELPLVQLFGFRIMQDLQSFDSNFSVNTKSCDGVFEKLGCGLLALSASVGAAVAVGNIADEDVSTETKLEWISYICDLLEFLGVDIDEIPVSDEQIQQVLDILDVDEVTAEQASCATALLVGIYDTVYDACCGPDECEEDPDPCCGVYCDYGYTCEEGVCVPIPDHCIHVGCPDGYLCNGATGDCYPDDGPSSRECETVRDCPNPFDYVCRNFQCVAI